jgi:Fe-S cluster assembly ATPase SufC
MTDILQVENLSLRRDGRDILRRVNLTVRAGEVHALLGLNGSGKSSLAYTLMGCAGYTPDAGRIVFDGRDVTALSISERARLGITLAWQEPARFEGLPVAQYVQLGTRRPQAAIGFATRSKRSRCRRTCTRDASWIKRCRVVNASASNSRRCLRCIRASRFSTNPIRGLTRSRSPTSAR